MTYVLSGGILAAFLGPTVANYTIELVGKKYMASFVFMGVIGALNEFVVSLVNFPPPIEQVAKEAVKNGRPLCTVITSPLFVLSCTIATLAHTVMVMIMSNCALAMKDDYSFTMTTVVMELHFFSMFAPGFFSGLLIGKYGPFNVAMIGALLFGMSAAGFALGTELWNYFTGMILLGIAWNFSFSAGTVMLTNCYEVYFVF